MHVQAAVVQGQLAAQGDLRQLLFVQRLAGLAQQGFEDAAFRHGQGDVALVDGDHAAHRAETQVAQLHLAGHGRRVAAAQHGAQAGGQLAGVAGLGQIVIGAQLQAQDAVQRFATRRQHQHRQIGVVVTQLLEQLKAAAIGKHDIQHHGIRAGLAQRLAGAGTIVASANLKAFLAQPTDQQLTQLLVIIYQ